MDLDSRLQVVEDHKDLADVTENFVMIQEASWGDRQEEEAQ